MSTHLRRLTTYVDEPEPGAYYWVMIESPSDASVWHEVEASAEAYCTWLEASLGGSSALMELVSDQQIGPREIGEDEAAHPVGPQFIASSGGTAPLDSGA